MVEQKSRTGEKAVSIPVIGNKRNGSGFSDAVRAFWMVSGALICRAPSRIAEYLGEDVDLLEKGLGCTLPE